MRHGASVPESVAHPASTIPEIRVPVCGYAMKMALATTMALGVCAIVEMACGAGSQATLLAVAALFAASFATFLPTIPTLNVTPANFGLFVLGGSMLRMLVLLGIGLAFDSTREFSPATRTAFWVGLLAGAGVVLVAESVLAIGILARIEKLKAQPRS